MKTVTLFRSEALLHCNLCAHCQSSRLMRYSGEKRGDYLLILSVFSVNQELESSAEDDIWEEMLEV